MLALDGNRFDGPLPTVGSTYPRLSVLSFANNFLTGSLPDEWTGHFKDIRTMTLANNQLSGSLPASWTQALTVQMQAVSLATNPCLCDTLPAWFTTA